MHSLRRIGRIASAGFVVLTASLYACSDAGNPERTVAPDRASNSAIGGTGTGLVAAYGFDEANGSTTADASGSANSGTLGDGVTRTTSGKFGGALAFTGGYLAVPGSSSLALSSAMTLEAWVSPSTVDASWRDVIQKGNDNYYLMASSDNGSRPAGGGKFGGASYTTKAFGTSMLATNVWTHLAVSYDGATIRLYVNGTQVSSVARTGAIMTSANPLTIGGDPIYGQYFKGVIDEVRIYNRALSATEIKTDMNTAITTTTTPPPPPSDTVAPTVGITNPSSTGTYGTIASTVSISGSASDNIGIAQVTWRNSAGGSGIATGTTTWSAANIALQSGSNIITVTARDAANNVASATIAVTKSDPPPPTPVGLVAEYGFEETSGSTTGDASGKGNGGSFGNGVSRTTSGKYGAALAFNNGSVTIPNSASLALTTAMTLEAWVNPSNVTSRWRDVIQKGKDNYYVMATTDNSSRPAAGGIFAGESRTTKAYGPAAIAANTWTHLAVTYDGSTLRFYVNGVQASTIARTGALMTSTDPLTLGGDPFFGQNFLGVIDEVRIYNRALSAAEVQTDMNSPVGTTVQPGQPAPQSDVTPPTIAISSPQASGTYTTTATSVSLGGTASDNVGVTQVRWSNSRGGSGTYSGTSNWSGSISLQSGSNVITITAQDAASNVATATLTVVSNAPTAPTATQLVITTQPSSAAQSGTAFAQQPVVQLRDASNNAVSQSGVVVTAAIVSGGGTLGGTTTATTNSSGVASFSNLSISGTDGARTLRFSAGSLASATSSSITISTPTTPPPATGSGSCANEPTGYTAITDQPWDNVPSHPTTSLGWVDDYWNAANMIPVVSDPTSPFPSSNHNVAAGMFPAGSKGGSAPFYVYRPFGTSEQFKNLYICLYLKHSTNFDNTNGNSGTKFLWPAADQTQGALTYNGHDGASMNFQFFQQGAVDRRLGANVNVTAATMIGRRGQWVRYEMLMKASSSNSASDGELHVWIDGVKTHQYTDVRWQMSAARRWLSLAWQPTYGGGFNPVPATQYQYMDNIHVSGSDK